MYSDAADVTRRDAYGYDAYSAYVFKSRNAPVEAVTATASADLAYTFCMVLMISLSKTDFPVPMYQDEYPYMSEVERHSCKRALHDSQNDDVPALPV
jgi:hypothetical protein